MLQIKSITKSLLALFIVGISLSSCKPKAVKTIASMKASVDSSSGQIIVWEDEDKVLQYNYQTVYEKDVVFILYLEVTISIPCMGWKAKC